MKIAILGQYPITTVYSGSSIYNRKVMDHLLAAIPEEEVAVFSASSNAIDAEVEIDPRIHLLRTGRLPPYYSAGFVRRLIRHVEDYRPDVVHTFSTEMPYATAAALLSRRYPSLMTVYGVAARETQYFCNEYTAFHQHLYRGLVVLNERWAIRSVPNLVVDTASVAAYLRRWTKAMFHVLPAGIDAEAIRALQAGMPDKGGPDIFVTVNLEHLKGIDLLIEAVARVRPRHPSISVLIGGTGPQAGTLQEQIDRLDLRDHVHLLGYIEDEEKHRLYRSCRLVVVPSRWDCQPAALFEAAVSGKPVIASDASNPGIVEEGLTGCVVPAGDIGALATAIARLLDDVPLCEAMGRRAGSEASAFDWANVAKEYINIYHRISQESVEITRAIGAGT